MTPEGKFKQKVLEFLKSRHIWHMVYVASSTFGIPDIVAIYGGLFVGIELKREDGKGKATLLQEETVAGINAAGGYAFIVSSIEDLVEQFDYIETIVKSRGAVRT